MRGRKKGKQQWVCTSVHLIAVRFRLALAAASATQRLEGLTGASLPVGQPGEAVWFRPGTSPGTTVLCMSLYSLRRFRVAPYGLRGVAVHNACCSSGYANWRATGKQTKVLGIFP
jgi:hypothetical protein